MWNVYTVDHYAAIKKNEMMPFVTTWMDLGIIILSEVSQTGKDKCIILLICGIWKKDTNELISKQKQVHKHRKQNPRHQFSFVWLFVTLWALACQAPLSMGFSRQEYCSELLCPPPGDLPSPGIEPTSLTSPALASRFFTISANWEAQHTYTAEQQTRITNKDPLHSTRGTPLSICNNL